MKIILDAKMGNYVKYESNILDRKDSYCTSCGKMIGINIVGGCSGKCTYCYLLSMGEIGSMPPSTLRVFTQEDYENLRETMRWKEYGATSISLLQAGDPLHNLPMQKEAMGMPVDAHHRMMADILSCKVYLSSQTEGLTAYASTAKPTQDVVLGTTLVDSNMKDRWQVGTESSKVKIDALNSYPGPTMAFIIMYDHEDRSYREVGDDIMSAITSSGLRRDTMFKIKPLRIANISNPSMGNNRYHSTFRMMNHNSGGFRYSGLQEAQMVLYMSDILREHGYYDRELCCIQQTTLNAIAENPAGHELSIDARMKINQLNLRAINAMAEDAIVDNGPIVPMKDSVANDKPQIELIYDTIVSKAVDGKVEFRSKAELCRLSNIFSNTGSGVLSQLQQRGLIKYYKKDQDPKSTSICIEVVEGKTIPSDVIYITGNQVKVMCAMGVLSNGPMEDGGNLVISRSELRDRSGIGEASFYTSIRPLIKKGCIEVISSRESGKPWVIRQLVKNSRIIVGTSTSENIPYTTVLEEYSRKYIDSLEE